MRIKELKLYTKHLKAQREFYSKTLGFQVLESGPSHFSVQIGWSLFTFAESQKTHDYHFCFLIPCNSLDSALEWMEKRITLILSPDGQKTHRFESWDADSFYFYDAGGNVVEFIVRHQLHNTIDVYFEVTHVFCVNEIGLPVADISKTNAQLEAAFGTRFWKGDFDRFGTHGSQEGLFLLPNYRVKEVWFPTSIKIRPEPFEAVIENNGKRYTLKSNGWDIKMA